MGNSQKKRRQRRKARGFGNADVIIKPGDQPQTADEVLAIVEMARSAGVAACFIESVCLSPKEMAKLQRSHLPVEVHIGGNTWAPVDLSHRRP
jgi:hypothetical protein